MKVIGLWSGGKDSCLACYRAKLEGYQIISLFNFMNLNGTGSLSHGLNPSIIQRQTELLEVSLFQRAMPKETYREEFKTAIDQWKKEKGIEGIVFGDIYLEAHKDWIDKVCEELEVKPILPLWRKDTSELIHEFIKTGFKAIVVSTRADILGGEWLGRKIDYAFVEDLKTLGNIDPCGENGEFHTFVYDGPNFKKALEFIIGKSILRHRHWFLELIPR